MKAVSIIIPTYNRLWSLPKAIGSCFQTALDIEVIVIDDGSTDGTAEWLSGRNDLVVISQQNQGKDIAVNNAFAIAKGKYVRFLDSDDWLLPGSTDLLFGQAEATGADVVAAGHEVYSEDEVKLNTVNWQVCDDFIAQQMGECDSSHYSAYLFKREFIKDIPHRQEFGARDDRRFIIEVALAQPKVTHISTPTLAHRVHTHARLQDQSDKNDRQNNEASLKIYEFAISTLKKNNVLTKRRTDAATKILWPLAHWTAKYDISKGAAIFKWIRELDPGFRITDKGILGILYRNAGFKVTEYLLHIRRKLMQILK